MSARLIGALILPAVLCFAQPKPVTLARVVADVAAKTIEQFGPGLTAEKIALTVVDLGNQSHPITASYRGEAPVYPASVVKLFYLVAAHAWMERGQLKQTPELDRAMHDMIVSSTNDATQMIVDALTDTAGGPELEPTALAAWMEKRNAVNRYFASLGYSGINVNQKTFAEGPYGRERQNRGPNFENNNRLTTNAVARLLLSIVIGKAVSEERSLAMMKLLRRDPFSKSANPDDQATKFSGAALPPGSEYYSKAGWTSTTRHDAAYIKLPNGKEYIAVVFTLDNSTRTEIIPFVSKLLVEHFTASVGMSADTAGRSACATFIRPHVASLAVKASSHRTSRPDQRLSRCKSLPDEPAAGKNLRRRELCRESHCPVRE